jgi:hypothetical protein
MDRMSKLGTACAMRKSGALLHEVRMVIKGAIMNNIGKVLIKMGLLSLLSVMPLAAQIDNGVDFTASFPFYAGDVKLPAGNYKVVRLDETADILQIENRDDLQSIFVDFRPTESALPHRDSAVTFEKYGNSDYLDRVWIAGEEYGISVDPGRAETAAEGNPTQHSTAAGGQ